MSIVKSLSVGNGDMYYIIHNSDNFTVIDCCMSDGDKADIVAEIKRASSGKGVERFISTHPDDDHIRGLGYLDQQIKIQNFYCVKNAATKDDASDDFDAYCDLRDDSGKAFYLFRGCKKIWMNASNEERDAAGIHILWPVRDSLSFIGALRDAAEGYSPNNISPIIQYLLNDGVKILWMGDLEADFMEEISEEIQLPQCDILFAPHHGRDSGKVPRNWLESIDPKVIIVGEAPSEQLHYYPECNTITQNTSGSITLDCVSGKVHIYVSNEGYTVNFLDDEGLPDSHGIYLGSLSL